MTFIWTSNAIESKKCYEIAKKYEKVVTVMEPIKGGNLVNQLPSEVNDLYAKNNIAPADIALRFSGSLDSVAVVLSGMGEKDQVIQNAKSLKTPVIFTDTEFQLVLEANQIIESVQAIGCTNCGYCLDVCPKQIPINDIFTLLNHETKNRRLINRNGKIFYRMNTNGKGKASSCIKCGKCEDICSQRLSIREYLNDAAKIFE